MADETLVIFRKYRAGDIVAVLPFEPGTYCPSTCMSYQHIGQHGSAGAALIMASTSPATPAEYAELLKELKELKGIGHKVKIGQRMPGNAYRVRREAINSIK